MSRAVWVLNSTIIARPAFAYPITWAEKAGLTCYSLGGAEGTRTPDPLHAMQMRYQLRHSPSGCGAQLREAVQATLTAYDFLALLAKRARNLSVTLVRWIWFWLQFSLWPWVW
jgi:hypothetical protein